MTYEFILWSILALGAFCVWFAFHTEKELRTKREAKRNASARRQGVSRGS